MTMLMHSQLLSDAVSFDVTSYPDWRHATLHLVFFPSFNPSSESLENLREI